MYILIQGNPVNGLAFFGPYDSPGAAVEAGHDLNSGDWWVASLDSPDDVG